MKNKPVKYIAKVGVLSAFAFVVMLLEFPLWFAPAFYKLDFSEVVALIGGFSLGPVAGVLIELVKNLLHILIRGTTTAGVGELANFVTGVLLVLPAAGLYRTKKCFSRALWGLLIGIVLLGIGGTLMNDLVMIPFYIGAFGLSADAIVEMAHAVNGAVTDLRTLLLFAVLPFNLFKGAAASVGTLLLYKRLSPLLHK